jgi:hypothetical protein
MGTDAQATRTSEKVNHIYFLGGHSAGLPDLLN